MKTEDYFEIKPEDHEDHLEGTRQKATKVAAVIINGIVADAWPKEQSMAATVMGYVNDTNSDLCVAINLAGQTWDANQEDSRRFYTLDGQFKRSLVKQLVVNLYLKARSN